MKASQRGDGFLHDGGNRVITWAFGHLLELYMPDDYDERYKSWSLETLPIAPESWRYNVRKSAFKQYKIVEGLVKRRAPSTSQRTTTEKVRLSPVRFWIDSATLALFAEFV